MIKKRSVEIVQDVLKLYNKQEGLAVASIARDVYITSRSKKS